MRSRRLPRCPRCGLAGEACLCDVLAPIRARCETLVLVHHVEAHKTTNTGRLAALALGARYERWGERAGTAPVLPAGRVLLLFPGGDARPLRADDAHGSPVLVAPDGNWAQARKIARRVHALCGERAVRVRVEPTAARAYRSRRTERPDALSTFEAIAEALAILEGDGGPRILDAARALFAELVVRQARASQRSAV